MSALFLGGCFFLLLAIFGVQTARFALALEEPVKKREPVHRRVLRAMGIIEDLTLVSWKYASEDPGIWDGGLHSLAEMEITLSDGTVWCGQEQWWWDKTTRTNPPEDYNDFLCELRAQIESNLLRAV